MKALQKIVPNSRIVKTVTNFAEFRTPTHQGIRKNGSKIVHSFAIVLH
jgi:hypothetical protein